MATKYDLLLWLPAEYQRVDDSSITKVSARTLPHRALVDLSNFVHGDSWTLELLNTPTTALVSCSSARYRLDSCTRNICNADFKYSGSMSKPELLGALDEAGAGRSIANLFLRSHALQVYINAYNMTVASCSTFQPILESKQVRHKNEP